MRLTKEEVSILLALLDSQVIGIEKEEVEMYIEEDNYFGIKSLKQAEVLFDKLRKKYQDLK
tara:strand:- start:616 stop:798 length:183 start_codon:yes stop_codon:yes gene_type:complete